MRADHHPRATARTNRIQHINANGAHMKKKGLYQWLHQFGVASSIAMGVWVTTADAATLNVPSTSTTGVFNVSYTGNSRSHVSFLEVDSDGSLTHIHTDSPAPASSSIAVSKPAGVYRYRLKLCDKATSGQPSNCSLSGIRSISVNISSTRASEQIDYTYDALGRVTSTRENGSLKSSYCYDAAGNRKKVTEGKNNASCNN